MPEEKDKKDKKFVLDGLGRPALCDRDSFYFVCFEKPIKDINDFFKNAEKTIDKTGFIKCYKEKPKSSKNAVKIKVKNKSRIASMSLPEHFSIMDKILTSYPNENLSKHEWKTIKYTGYCGVYNPAEKIILVCDPHCIEYKGIEYNI